MWKLTCLILILLIMYMMCVRYCAISHGTILPSVLVTKRCAQCTFLSSKSVRGGTQTVTNCNNLVKWSWLLESEEERLNDQLLSIHCPAHYYKPVNNPPTYLDLKEEKNQQYIITCCQLWWGGCSSAGRAGQDMTWPSVKWWLYCPSVDPRRSLAVALHANNLPPSVLMCVAVR